MTKQHSNGNKVELPYFSIIVPTYNRAGLIQDSLRTVLQQNFNDFEVLIIDDCSTDNTVEVIQDFLEDSRFRLISNPVNYERSKSRNIGFEQAKGKYLTLLDSDDFMYKDNLRDAYLFSKQHPHFKFFYNRCELVNENKQVIYTYKYPKQKHQLRAFAEGNFLSCIGVFLHREVYSQNFFDEDPNILGYSEDWEFWLRLRAKFDLGEIKKINSALLEHRERSVKHFNLIDIEEHKQYIIKKVLENPITSPVYSKYRKNMYAHAHIFAAIHANSLRFSTISFKYLIKSIRLKPSVIFQMRFLIVLKNTLKAFLSQRNS